MRSAWRGAIAARRRASGEVIPTDFTITPPTSSYNANALSPAHATNTAGTSNGLAAPNTAVVPSDTTDFTFCSIYESRDQEVVWKSNGNYAYLRLKNGKAYYCAINSTGVNGSAGLITIGIATGINETNSTVTAYALMYTDNADAVYPEYVHNSPTTMEYTFGVVGFTLYLKINGTTVWTAKDYNHCVSGKVACRNWGSQRLYATTVNFFARSAMYSDVGSGRYDLRDLGLKTITGVTGSITAASTTLTVSDATDIAVGDWLMLPVGYEAGAGARGTKGVGGSWPALSYANGAARAADTTQANNTYAWEEDTGNVYRWATGAPGSWTQQTSNYYTAKANPRGYRAKVVSKAGNDLTMSVAATVTATNAPVRYDATPIINQIGQRYSDNGTDPINDIKPDDITIVIPAGDHYVTGTIHPPDSDRVVFTGTGQNATRLISVPGHRPANILMKSQSGVVRDLYLEGNAALNGWGLGWATSNRPIGFDTSGQFQLESGGSTGVTETAITSGPNHPNGILLEQIGSGVIRNCTVKNAWQQAIGASYCGSPNAYDCTIQVTVPIMTYIQWMCQFADCNTSGGVDGLVIESDYLVAGVEMFKCTDIVFQNITATNASFATNGSERSYYRNVDITIEANSQYPSSGFSEANPIVNINNNIGVAANLVDEGVEMDGFTITLEGVINADNDLLGGVAVSGQTPACRIKNGVITYPDFVVGGQTNVAHLASNGANADFENIDTYGKSVYQVTGSGSRAVSHAANSTAASGSTNTNIRTFAANLTEITPADVTAPA